MRFALSTVMSLVDVVGVVVNATLAHGATAATSYAASVSHPAPFSQVTGASAGGNGYAVAIYGSRV